MSNATTNLIVRRDTKQGWAQAPRIAMKDTHERLTEVAGILNDELGWKKYGVEEPAKPAEEAGLLEAVENVLYADPADVYIEQTAEQAAAEDN